jgi:hypothetical protein
VENDLSVNQHSTKLKSTSSAESMKQYVGQMFVGQTPVGQMTVAQMSIGHTTVAK